MQTDALRALIDRGQRADFVLDAEAFRDAIDELNEFHVSALLACKPIVADDRDARDYHHSMATAVTELVQTLSQWSVAGKQAAAVLEMELQYDDAAHTKD